MQIVSKIRDYLRIIHKNNPRFNRKKFQFEFANGEVLRLKLYEIEQRLSQGSSVRYNAQYGKFHTLQCLDKDLQSLVDLINKYHRCYDQEGYIAKNDIGKYYSSK